ncbi:hypothetical protein HYY74_06480 [Candidatus Woesearchaeota archaeon]|nr:hypothetical protein [Candidatus Woesearchaeota archaeon]
MSASDVRERARPGEGVRVVGTLERIVAEDPEPGTRPRGFVPGYMARINCNGDVIEISSRQSVHPDFVQEMERRKGEMVAVSGQVRGARSSRRIAVDDVQFLGYRQAQSVNYGDR